jgi:hypothetical protein
MPLYYFRCRSCHLEQRRILKPEEALGLRCSCTGELERTPRPPSARVTETLDNGVMTKRLERLADAERLFSERNEAVKKSQGG